MSTAPRRYTPAIGPAIEVCRVSQLGKVTFVDMNLCCYCRQINHEYRATGTQLSQCRRGLVNIKFLIEGDEI
jgi:hypothetical protein